MKINLFLLISYRFCFLWFCPLTWTEFVSRALFVFAKFRLFLRLFLMIWFSLLFLILLLFCTFVAWSNRSFRLSPMTRKFGRRIQQVFTEQDPDIPWHLHSSRISVCTCCNNREKREVRSIIEWVILENSSFIWWEPLKIFLGRYLSGNINGVYMKIIQLMSINEILKSDLIVLLSIIFIKRAAAYQHQVSVKTWRQKNKKKI